MLYGHDMQGVIVASGALGVMGFARTDPVINAIEVAGLENIMALVY